MSNVKDEPKPTSKCCTDIITFPYEPCGVNNLNCGAHGICVCDGGIGATNCKLSKQPSCRCDENFGGDRCEVNKCLEAQCKSFKNSNLKMMCLEKTPELFPAKDFPSNLIVKASFDKNTLWPQNSTITVGFVKPYPEDSSFFVDSNGKLGFGYRLPVHPDPDEPKADPLQKLVGNQKYSEWEKIENSIRNECHYNETCENQKICKACYQKKYNMNAYYKHTVTKAIQLIVKQRFEPITNLTFKFIHDAKKTNNADITISFKPGACSSRRGTDSKRDYPSMNLSWFRVEDVLHEFGHALGMIHEHQNPRAGIQWNKEKVYQAYYCTQKWSCLRTNLNILRKYDKDSFNSSVYDPDSIMVYAIPAWATTNNTEMKANKRLSIMDIHWLMKMYPKNPPFSPYDPTKAMNEKDPSWRNSAESPSDFDKRIRNDAAKFFRKTYNEDPPSGYGEDDGGDDGGDDDNEKPKSYQTNYTWSIVVIAVVLILAIALLFWFVL